MPLFEVVFIKKPTKLEAEDGEVESLLFGPVAVVAKDRQSAIVAATLQANDETDISPADAGTADVLVRPFV